MGDAAYKARKREEWVRLGRCPACGREKASEAKHCDTCQRRHRERHARGEFERDNREKPRVDGDWIYA